ncbi:MAG: hypothetical protein K0U93_05775, partial [Gammaproteobacteria bacterium]|nr:hypothetical protein [Gammaproteobacteria bacterium]
MEFKDNTKISELMCCPTLKSVDNCDTLDIKYRLPFRRTVQGQRSVLVEVLLHFRFSRCSGDLTLGDLCYSTTLLPGERVRLFTADRNTRWSFDNETNLAYRHETTSEESYLVAGMASAMSDLTVVESGSSSNSFNESAVSGGGGAGLDLGIVEIGGSAAASSYSASSASSFAQNFSQHAESSSRHVEAGIRAASSTSIGEVETRAHAEGESESHFESASRVFNNPNRCHAITFFFYKLNKCQTFKFDLVAIERNVVDVSAPTTPVRKPIGALNKVTVLPKSVLSTSSRRLDVGRTAKVSAVEEAQTASANIGSVALNRGGNFSGSDAPIPDAMQKAAIAAVDKELATEGLIDAESGAASKDAIRRFSWVRTTTLPSAGIIVKGCLDDCNVCEPSLVEEIEIDL